MINSTYNAAPIAPAAGHRTRWVASWIDHEVSRGVAHKVTDDGPPRFHYRYAVCSAMTMDIPVEVEPRPRRWCAACRGMSGAAA